MYAVILTGGKQYKVKKGDAIIVERLTLPKRKKR
jgi:ribosomal protein L21